MLMIMYLPAAASPVVKSPAIKTSSPPSSSPAAKKVRASLNAPVQMPVVNLSDVQLVGVDSDDVCLECQKPMDANEHYKSVRHINSV